MIGFPGEYEEDVFYSIKINKKIRALHPELTSCKMSYVAPYEGTVMHNISADLGLIEVDGAHPDIRVLPKILVCLRSQ